MSKLNGWRRLYIVVFILSLGFAVFIMFVNMPKEHDSYYFPDEDILAELKNPQCKTVIQNPNYSQRYIEDCNTINRYRSIHEVSVQTREEYIAHVDLIRDERVIKIVSLALLSWFFGMILLYCAGLVCAWILKGGFRSNS